MPEDTTKRINVTFGTGLPHGQHATFKHDGKFWIAYPAAKNARITAVIDRMLGIFSSIQTEMIRWINNSPGDAEKVTRILELVGRARKLQHELTIEKMKAWTM